jgi:hypothetical protein
MCVKSYYYKHEDTTAQRHEVFICKIFYVMSLCRRVFVLAKKNIN